MDGIGSLFGDDDDDLQLNSFVPASLPSNSSSSLKRRSFKHSSYYERRPESRFVGLWNQYVQ